MNLINRQLDPGRFEYSPHLESLYGTHKVVGVDVKPVVLVRTIATFDVPRIFSALALNSLTTYLSIASSFASSAVTRFPSLLNSPAILPTFVFNSSTVALGFRSPP
jgi:hypothetical protein